MIDYLQNNGEIPIIHVPASQALVLYKKPDFVNGCRIGKLMYGFSEDESINLESVFSLKSEVIQINHLKKGDTVRIWRNI